MRHYLLITFSILSTQCASTEFGEFNRCNTTEQYFFNPKFFQIMDPIESKVLSGNFHENQIDDLKNGVFDSDFLVKDFAVVLQDHRGWYYDKGFYNN